MVSDAVSGWDSWYLKVCQRDHYIIFFYLEKLGLWGACPYGINWLARTVRTGLMGWREHTGQDKGEAGGLMLEGNGSGMPSLAIEV